MKIFFKRMKVKGRCPPRVPLKKIYWSCLGSFLGVFLVGWFGCLLQSVGEAELFLIGSFGASAVLVYGVPLMQLSQPRNLIGGHFLSAIVGVTVNIVLGDNVVLASALAVSIAICVMHFSRTLHPPGGATALIAVIGGERVHSLGYMYTLKPVLLGALIMLIVALLVNNLSTDQNRHYPVYWF